MHPLSALVFFAWVLAVQLTGLAAFTKGFFLTRVELGRQSHCDVRSLLTAGELEHLSNVALQQQRQHQGQQQQQPPSPLHPSPLDGCWLPPRFKRVVWVVVDALRYDFATFSPPSGGEDSGEDGRESKTHSAGARHYLNHLPVISEAIGGGAGGKGAPSAAFEGSGGVLFQFEADPPTVTMQRLKGLTTGGLPTFIDFRDNFHSPEIAEDNWVAQVRERAAARRRRRQGAGGDGSGGDRDRGQGEGEGGELVFMGDDTWTSLYPTYFSRSFPFPSFNTRDLHTVDDGVLSHLETELAKRDWDVLVAHFLGVDHVGHTFGPASQAMEDKLDQINTALRTVFESVDDDTVVFVLGDHGMTEDGNHGGATPEETGAALLVWSPSGERLLGPDPLGGGDDAAAVSPETRGDRMGSVLTGGAAAVGAGGEVGDREGSDSGRDGGGRPAVTGRKVAQIDLVPTISLLLGTPIPFGSLGGVIPEVFAGPYYGGEESAGEAAGVGYDDPRYLERLCDALLVNSAQVWRYLSEYAGVASMPTEAMFELKELLMTAREAHAEWVRQRKLQSQRSRKTPPGVAGAGGARDLHRVCDMYREFLDTAIGLGRSLWTQYDTSLMWWGLAVLLAATAALASRAAASWPPPGRRSDVLPPGSSIPGAAAASGAVASMAVAFATDAVFGSSGGHVFTAKVALCSSLLVCAHYAQVMFLRAGCGGGGGSSPPPGTEEEYLLLSKKNCNHHHVEAAAAAAAASGDGILLGTALPSGLSALYCAGLFSNSFIEAEDGLHRFLGASSLVSLSVLFLLVRGRRTGTGTGGGGGNSRSRLKSPMFAAALHAGLAAALFRAAAAVQETAAEAGVSAEATFGVARSLLPLPALWYLCRLARRGGGGGGGGAGDVRGVLGTPTRLASRRCVHGVVQALSLAAVGLYWVIETASAGTDKDHGAAKEEASGAAVKRDDGAPGSPSAAALAVEASYGLLPPTRLLLPRAVYLLCFGGLAAALLRPAARRRRRQQQDPSAAPKRRNGWEGLGKDGGKKAAATAAAAASEGGEGAEGLEPSSSYARALAATAGAVVSHVLPVVVLLLGPGMPAVVALVSAACGCVLRSVSIAAATVAASTGTSSRPALLPLGAVAVAWSVVGRAFFFLTGHHNQFSRLQYSAAFVGFDTFDFKIGGLLLFLNTFGTEILAALALPLAAAAAAAGEVSGGDSCTGGRADSPPAAVGAESGSRRQRHWHLARSSPPPNAAAGGETSGEDDGPARVLTAMERLSALTLLLSSFRTFLSAANVSVQRGHLMLWAVFAPKFVFDATMQAVCGAAAVFAWAVVLVAHRAYYYRYHHHPGEGISLASLGYYRGLVPWRASLPTRQKAR